MLTSLLLLCRSTLVDIATVPVVHRRILVLLSERQPYCIQAEKVNAAHKRDLIEDINYFVEALIAIPTTIAENAGLDSAELVAQLRAEHQKEGCIAGIDVITRSVSTEVRSILMLSFEGMLYQH
ncbi:hypothetical protein LWI29_018251 [Acer saccharum]|uniref:Uncharacterized protein n=1 Tax=Acer saccharum TaxID=4024 RepID=A0AA39W8K2_ACESA|nr:hypothetical protein LWI29_018251 [Acer saccharum]